MPRTKVCTYIDEGVRWDFEKRFGGYASIAWLMETAMRGLLEDTKGDPTLEDLVRTSIHAHILKYKKHDHITAGA